MRRRQYALVLGLIVLVGLGVRLGFVAAYDQILEDGWAELPPGSDLPLVGDAYFYYWVGQQIADGDGYVRPYELRETDTRIATAERPPLFPALLAIPSALGAPSIAAAGILCSVIGAASLLLVAALGRRVAGDAVGLVAAGLAAVYPILWQPNAMLFVETLFVPLVTAILLLVYGIREHPTRWRWCALGVLIGLAGLTRGEGLAYLFVLGLPLVWWSAPTLRGRVVPGLLLASTAIVVVAPWTVRNLRTFDEFVLVSNNLHIALSGANCDAVYEGREIGSFNIACFVDDVRATVGEHRPWEEDQVFAAVGADGLEYMSEHRGRLPAVLSARVLRTWGLWPPGPILDYDELDYGVSGPLKVGYAMYYVMLPLAVGGVVVLRRRDVVVWPLLAPAVLVVGTSLALHGLTRFRAAMEVPIVVLASVAIVTAASQLVPRSNVASATLATPVTKAASRRVSPSSVARCRTWR